jgi:hypothetical protein
MDEKQLQEMMDEVTKGREFNGRQMKQIGLGFEYGLSVEQVQTYTNPKFDNYQMWEIRKGFENGLTMKQVQFYADPKFDGWQMDEIRLGFKHGLSMEQVQVYSDSKFDWEQMDEIRLGFKHGLTMEQVQSYGEFDKNLMQEMRKEAELHLSETTTRYKGELGEFDYNRSDFVLLQDREGKDYLHYNEYIGNTTLDLPNGITNTRNMFKDCTLPDGFAFGDFDTSKVTDMSGMFENCSMLDIFTLGNGFNTRNVEDMSYMFNGCSVPDDFVFNDKFVINDNCIVDNMFEDSDIDDLSPLEEPDLEVDGTSL